MFENDTPWTNLSVPKEDPNMGQPSCRANQIMMVAARRSADMQWSNFFPFNVGCHKPFYHEIFQKQDFKMPPRYGVNS